ncbi:MAG: signal transduction histidine kinase [Haloquadratum sp. J07HQX50]|nr:MAG: signal transduction histidine kinase [Haloquadratum sp. J07HQX50]
MSTAYQLTPPMPLYAVIFFVSSMLSIYAVMRYYRHDRRLIVGVFAVMTAAMASWELLNFLIDSVTSEQLKLLGKNLVNGISYPVYAYSVLGFSLIYANHTRWIRVNALVCAAHIICGSVILFVSPEILYTSGGLTVQGPTTIAGASFNQFVTLDRTLRQAFLYLWAHGILVFTISTAVLLRYIVQSRRDVATGQAVSVVVGILAPACASVLLITGTISPAWNPTDLSFSITAVCFGLTVFRYNLFQMVPIGRQQVVRTMSDPMVVVDSNDRVVDSNLTARNLFDVESDWRGIPTQEFFDSPINRFTGSQETIEVDTELIIQQDGQRRHFDLERTLLRDQVQGKTTGQIIVFRDVTELIETRQQIKRRELRLKKLLDTMSALIQTGSYKKVAKIGVEAASEVFDARISMVYKYDLKSNTLQPVAASGNQDALSDESLVLNPSESVIWEAFRSKQIQVCDDILTELSHLNDGGSIQSEAILPLGESYLMHIGLSESSIESEDMSLVRVFAANLEAALKRADREQELTRQNERLDEFAGIVSHDLRTPLNHAMHHTNLITEAQASDDVESVQQSLDQIESIVDGILRLTRAGETAEVYENCVVKDIIMEVWDAMAIDEAILDCRVEDMTIKAEEIALFRFFENLFRNVNQHTDPPRVVQVGTLPENDKQIGDNSYTGFFIEDNGDGISETAMGRIFEHGFTTSSDGSGYGLSIVQRIAESHGWRLSVTNGADGGARFEITGVMSHSSA